MSKIKKMIQSRLNELALIELQEEGSDQKSGMVGVSLRITSDTVDTIDLVAEKLQLSRSDVMRSFLATGATEALDTLNLSVTDVIDFIEANNEKKINDLIEGANGNE